MSGRGLLRAAVLIPWAIPTIVSAQMWGWMLNDQYGVINEILLWAGLISERMAWTANPSTALPAVIAVDVWKTTPLRLTASDMATDLRFGRAGGACSRRRPRVRP